MQENSAYTGVGFSLKLGFTKILLTPVFPLQLIEKSGEALYLRGCLLASGLVGWSVGCNAGYSSDVTLALEDAQIIPPFCGCGCWRY